MTKLIKFGVKYKLGFNCSEKILSVSLILFMPAKTKPDACFLNFECPEMLPIR